MKYQHVILLLGFTLLSGCDDVPSNRKQEAFRPPVKPEILPVEVFSGIHRSRNFAPISYKAEIKLNSEHTKLRAIPDIRLDDDGGDEKNVTHLRIRPDKLCGQDEKATLKKKILDCFTKNGDQSIWDGTIQAGSAESTWVLVTKSEKGTTDKTEFEVWLDQRTGMVWSEIISITANWCQASGSDLGLEANAVGIDCLTIGKGESLCTKHKPIDLPNVTWRLPTRHDYLQADLDGIRFVLVKGNIPFWTATTATDKKVRDTAWTYNMGNGSLAGELMSAERAVRCIGTPNF